VEVSLTGTVAEHKALRLCETAELPQRGGQRQLGNSRKARFEDRATRNRFLQALMTIFVALTLRASLSINSQRGKNLSALDDDEEYWRWNNTQFNVATSYYM
jgi:hypothetical protein